MTGREAQALVVERWTEDTGPSWNNSQRCERNVCTVPIVSETVEKMEETGLHGKKLRSALDGVRSWIPRK